MKKPPPPERPPEGLDSRRAALDILTLVRGGAGIEEALAKCRSFDALMGSDRGFARALATMVLRRQGSLDTLIGAYIDRPLPKRAARATDILRLSAAQTTFLDTPDHAAVSIAVALARSFQETDGYAGLINAVARKIAAKGKSVAADLPARVDTPGWMWRSWERAYGPEKARAIAAAHQAEPPIDITLKDPADAASWAEKLNAKQLLTGSLRLQQSARIPALPGFDDGAWWVQDAAAALPAKLFGDIAGKTVLDLCAAPGGKTMQLAAAGGVVTAVDIAGPRLRLIAENLQRTGLKAETVKADILNWAPPQKFDAILLDAPCSATGTIRRHPDILYSKKADDVAALSQMQREMIDRAVGFLNPGGVLVYATCSLQPEEGEHQTKAALERHPELTRAPIEMEEIGGLKNTITRSGDMRTFPSQLSEIGGMDGFFAARFRLEAA